jgi:hypothetical protein
MPAFERKYHSTTLQTPQGEKSFSLILLASLIKFFSFFYFYNYYLGNFSSTVFSDETDLRLRIESEDSTPLFCEKKYNRRSSTKSITTQNERLSSKNSLHET